MSGGLTVPPFYLGHFCYQFLSCFFGLIGSEPGHIVRTVTGAEDQIAKQIGPEGKGL